MTDERPDKPEREPKDELDEQEIVEEDPDEVRFRQGIEELEAKAATVKAPDLNPMSKEFDERLRALEERVSAQKTVRDAKQVDRARADRQDRESARGLGFGLSIAYTIVGMPLFGYGIGWLIDRGLKTQVWAGLGMLIGAVGGIAFVFVLLNRQNQGQ